MKPTLAASDNPRGQFFKQVRACRHDATAQARAVELPTSEFGKAMNKEETMAIKPPPPKNLCPICGTPSYSVGGVHPQCAIQQADEPRLKRLRATRATESTAKKPLPGKWKKRCPICGTEAHVRRQACRCGHKFEKR